MTIKQPQKRKEFVGNRYDIEFALAQFPVAAVVLYALEIPPEFYLNPKDVCRAGYGGLYKMNTYRGQSKNMERDTGVPYGLLSGEIAKDPAQLSPILGSTLSMHEILKAGIPVTIVTTDAGRRRIDWPSHYVQILPGSLLSKKNNLTLITVDQKFFDANKIVEVKEFSENANTVDTYIRMPMPMAGYYWQDAKGIPHEAAMFDKPVCLPPVKGVTNKVSGKYASLHVDNINGMLMKLNLPTIYEMAAPELNRPGFFGKLKEQIGVLRAAC
jgi:hypothetical protein